MSWLIAIVSLFLAYMLFESWIAEYHSFKQMEHERYLEWIRNGKK